MRQTITSALNTLLSQKLAVLLGTLWAPILSVAAVARHGLAQLIPQPAEEWAVLTTAAALAGLITSVASYYWFRPKLIEHYGAFFKRKPNGEYHEAVYCGICKNPTSSEKYGIHYSEKFICHCGWKSSFNLGQLNNVRSQLPAP